MRSVLPAAFVAVAFAVLPCAAQSPSLGEELPAPVQPSSTTLYSPAIRALPRDSRLARTAQPPRDGADAAAGPAAPDAAGAGPAPGLTLATIPVGEPANVAVLSPDERWVYALTQGESTILVIDLLALEVAHRFSFPYALWSLAISGDGSRLFVSATRPPGAPHDPCVFIIVGSLSKSSLLVVDARSGTVLDRAALPAVSFHVLLSPDGSDVVAVTSHEVDVVDLRSPRTVSRRLAAPSGLSLYSAVFAAGGKKLFASAPGQGLAVVDLASGLAHALAPPDGYIFVGIETSVVPAEDRVFTSLEDASGHLALAVIDAATEEVVVVPAAKAGGYGGVLFSSKLSRLFLPGSGLALDAVSLQPVGTLPDEHLDRLTGVVGQLSPDQSILYFRPFGGAEDSLILWGDPARYDLAVVDTQSLQEVAHFNLDRRRIHCSASSPLLIGKSGRTLVAPNPTLETVSVVKVSPRPH